MRRAEVACAMLLLGVAAVCMVEAVRLGSGWGPAGPRAGFFPFWLSVILGLSSLGILREAIRANPGSGVARKPFVTREALKSVLGVIVPMAGAVILFELVGFYLASALYLVFFTRWMGRHRWPVVLAASLAFPVVTFLVFERWFLIPLPKGAFGGVLLF